MESSEWAAAIKNLIEEAEREEVYTYVVNDCCGRSKRMSVWVDDFIVWGEADES